MEYTSGLEEHAKPCQTFQSRGDPFNYNPGTSVTQPLVYDTHLPLHDSSMSHTSASLDPSRTMHTQPAASAVEERPIFFADWSHYGTSMSRASTVRQPHAHSTDSSLCYPSMAQASTVGQPPVLSANWSRYDRSMSRASMI
ncbi:hypothetical protein N7463_000594 [Penicillium fimorum]|uniref:Uncharacterized protein n=1 Tax=Penicillium fimorum TaxID=1882269 RepID=A0A9W9Y4S9_9EURO|nr:hypothetical protein N7463_000594 [Penicillium fimorum]